MQRISLLVAMARNRVIGRDNRIPWHLPADLKRFKELTMGHHIVMGRKTWESINRLLPGRITVIVTRNPAFDVPGAKIARSIEAALQRCGDDPEIFVIGGEQIFRAALPYAQRLYLSAIDAEIAGDTFMPAFDMSEWQLTHEEAHPAQAESLPWRFQIFDRRPSAGASTS
jgi:dihydrofolate reductase